MVVIHCNYSNFNPGNGVLSFRSCSKQLQNVLENAKIGWAHWAQAWNNHERFISDFLLTHENIVYKRQIMYDYLFNRTYFLSIGGD